MAAVKSLWVMALRQRLKKTPSIFFRHFLPLRMTGQGDYPSCGFAQALAKSVALAEDRILARLRYNADMPCIQRPDWIP
jgi:hypothetical protein